MAERPWLSVILPTLGLRLDGLRRALDSVARQSDPSGVEVVVVGDTMDGPLPEVQRIAAAYGHRFEYLYRYVAHDGGIHAWGHPQRTAGMRAAVGRWCAFLADDDIWTRNALGDIRAVLANVEAETPPAATPPPVFFRFVPPWRGVPIPVEPVLRERNIDVSCIVVPNVADLPAFGTHYEADYAFAAEVVYRLGAPVWANHVICWARPEPRDDWMAAQRRTEADRAAGTLRLNLGCGQFRLEGFTNVDADGRTPADEHYTFPPLPYADNTVAEIYMGHVLEHLRYADGQALLRECLRVLNQGGRLGVVVPDTRVILEQYLLRTDQTVEMPPGRFWKMADLDDVCATFLYSTFQDSPHAWSFDEITLKRALERAGFVVTGAIDRINDPRIALGAWYQVGADAIKPEEVA